MDTRLNAVLIYKGNHFTPAPLCMDGALHILPVLIQKHNVLIFLCDNEAHNVLRHKQKQREKKMTKQKVK